MSKLYIVFENAAAGAVWIEEVEEDSNWTYQQLGGCHANDVFESNYKEDCEKYINQAIEASTRFVVFTKKDSNGKDCYWYEKVNCCSGTYEEIGGKHSNWIKEVDTEDDAKEYLEKYCY